MVGHISFDGKSGLLIYGNQAEFGVGRTDIMRRATGRPPCLVKGSIVTEERENQFKENWTRAYVCLGSNDGDRVGYVQQAMQLFKDYSEIEVVECSSLYETEPVGNEYVEWFVNAVAAIETSLSLAELLSVCAEIEKRLAALAGAQSPEVFRESASGLTKMRIIDLDILFYGEEQVKTSQLVVPHPKLTRRAYALVPLLEIAPELRHPTLGKTIAEIHENLLAPEQVFLYGTRNSCPEFGS